MIVLSHKPSVFHPLWTKKSSSDDFWLWWCVILQISIFIFNTQSFELTFALMIGHAESKRLTLNVLKIVFQQLSANKSLCACNLKWMHIFKWNKTFPLKPDNKYSEHSISKIAGDRTKEQTIEDHLPKHQMF